MLKQTIEGYNIADIIPSIEYFNKNINSFKNKDIYSYNAKELEDAIKNIKFLKEEKEFKKGEADKLYNSDRFILIRPDNQNACIRYGKGTQWCISANNNQEYYEYLANNDLLYFLIDKMAENQSNMGKIGFRVFRDSDNKVTNYIIYNSIDNEIFDDNVEEYIGKENFIKILNLIKLDAESRPKTKLNILSDYIENETNEKILENI